MTIRSHKGIRPHLARTVYIDETAVVIGNVTIGEDSSIWPGAVVRGDLMKITIGQRTSIQDNSVIHTTHDGPHSPGGYPTSIGNEVTVGHSVTMHGCVIHDRVLIGIGTNVLDNAIVESNVVIGAGSLVPPGKKLESGYLYFGSPCKQARPLNERELEFFEYTAKYYVNLKNEHRSESQP